MEKYTFTHETLTVGEKVFPARYELQDEADMKRGQVFPTIHIWATVDEKAVLIDVPADDPAYGAALKACKETPAQAEEEAQEEARQEEKAPAQAEEETPTPPDHSMPEEAPAQEEKEEPPQAEEAPAQAEEEAQQEEEAPAQEEKEEPSQEEEAPAQEEEAPTPPDHSMPEEAPARDPKQARGPIPEKTFAGTSIKGERYTIVFDDVAQRTRVIIPQEYRAQLRAAVEKAGFYYSPVLDSWNKKLTFKAYRAAQTLAQELDALAA